jgi:uncharacterized surface protein with fasciclin (FAS1) repeats
MKKLIAILAVVTSMAVLSPAAALADEADSATMPTLAEILLSDSESDTDGFDRRSWDYDIVTQAILAFDDLTAAALNPDAELTVFLPRDSAFRRLVYEISGEWIRSEAKVFDAVVGLGLDTVKTVLEYHVVPGAKIDYRTALQANGAELTTLLGEEGPKITVKVKSFLWWKWIKLVDADTNDRNPRVSQPNIGGEASNGFAHGINRVLRPIDLP